jgi:galactose mutarotase-like enzyme
MEKITIDGLDCQRLRVGASTYTLCMERGARLMSWEMELPTGRREVIHWPQSGADYSRFANIRGGNPVLFPFAGRGHVGGAPGWWVDPEGVKRPYPQHGLVRQGACEIVESGADFIAAKFIPAAGDETVYPYSYDFIVRYRFRELGFTVEFELRNRDSKRMPWGPGHHFYFTLPWHKGLTRKDYVMRLDAKKVLFHAGDGSFVPKSGIELPVAFDHSGLSDTMFTKIKGDSVSFGPRHGEEDIRISFDSGAASTVVTWTQDDASPFYCVEPWACLPNSQANKFQGARWVESGCTDKFVCKVELA